MAENKDIPAEAVVEVIESGPLRISGNFILKDLKRDNESAPGEVWLCRCGLSSDKPYCDGSHKNR
jgi:CDGSH-type Zn-finger protein